MHEVAQRQIHGEDRAGQGAVGQTAGAVFDGDGLAAQFGVAFGQAGGADGVGDEQGAIGSFAAGQHLHHGRVDVDVVGDELGEDAVVAEHSAHDAGFAVVQARHGVEGVGGLKHAAIYGGDGLVVAGGGVAHHEVYAATTGKIDQRRCARTFRRNRDQLHRPGVEQFLKFGQIGIAYIFYGLCAGKFGAEEWPFQVDAQEARAG